MLNEYEQRQLDTIEEVLLRDPDLSACFREEHSARVPRQFPRPRCLVIPGVLITVIAAFLGLGEASVQGLGLLFLGLAWWAAINPPIRRRVMRSIKYCAGNLKMPWFPPAP